MRFVRFEAWVHFQLHDGDDLTLHQQAGLWTFLAPLDEEMVAQKQKLEKIEARLRRAQNAASRVVATVSRASRASRAATADTDTDEVRGAGWWTARGIVVNSVWRHSKRGVGTVVAISPDGDARVHVEFAGVDPGRVQVHRYYAKSWGKFVPFVAAPLVVSGLATAHQVSVVNPLDGLSEARQEVLRDGMATVDSFLL